MPVPHPVALGKSVTLGKSETTTVLVFVSDTVQRIVTVRYNTVLADSDDTSTVPYSYGPAAYLYRVSVQNFTARIRNCTESNGHADRMTDSTFIQNVSKTYKNKQYGTRYGF